MIDEKFVKEIASMAAPLVKTVDGVTFASEVLHEIHHEEYQIETLQVQTLTAIVDYIQANREALVLKDLFVHINDYTTVTLVKRYEGEKKRRNVILLAKMDRNCEVFPFDNFIGQETFIIKALSLLEENEDREKLLKLIETIKDAKIVEQSDNKVSQQFHVKTGVHLLSDELQPLKNTYKLKPYRTFREAEQPDSTFVLRVKSGGGEHSPTVALFEADGGAWKLQAIQNIKTWLQGKILDIPILA